MVTFNPPTSGLSRRGRRLAVVAGFVMVTTAPVWAGAASPPPIVSRISPPSGTAGFGAAVAGLGDVDGDGSGDVIVGAPGSERAFLVSGATGRILRDIVDPTPRGADFGFAVAAVGDLDRDGSADLAVGAPSRALVCPPAEPCRQDQAVRGRALVFSATSGSVVRELVPGTVHPGFGRTISGIGDVSGDGVADVVVGAPGGPGPSAVFAFSGADGAQLWSQGGPSEGPGPSAAFGEPLLVVPDVSGDGIDDVLASAPWGVNGSPPAGRVYVLSGATGAVVRIISGTASVADAFGAAMATVGDQDGDGVVDHLVAAPPTGQLHLYSGDDGVLVATLPLPADPRGQGVSLTGVGDENGDGRDDVWVGIRSARTVYLLDARGEVLSSTTSPSAEGAFGQVADAVGGIEAGAGADLAVGDSTEPGGGALYLVRADPVLPQVTDRLDQFAGATAEATAPPAAQLSQLAEATAPPAAQPAQLSQVAEATAPPAAQVTAQATAQVTTTTVASAAGPTTTRPTTATTAAPAKATLSKPAGVTTAGGTLSKTGGVGPVGLGAGALVLGIAALAVARRLDGPEPVREAPGTNDPHA